VEDLLICCSGRRVAVVRARHDLLSRAEAEPSDQVVATALGFVDDMLAQDVWDVA
jgi:hypothetical protein